MALPLYPLRSTCELHRRGSVIANVIGLRNVHGDWVAPLQNCTRVNGVFRLAVLPIHRGNAEQWMILKPRFFCLRQAMLDHRGGSYDTVSDATLNAG